MPAWLKLGYAGLLAVLVPVYWREYGPRNFLWWSDIALGSTAAAVIAESPELAGMMAVGVLPLELAWNADFATGGRLGLASYMFDKRLSRFLRGLSLFHVALPPTLIWMLRRFGYDRRSLLRQALLSWTLLPLTYAVTDPASNINWVFGPGSSPQRRVPPLAYLALEMVALPLIAFLPTHLLLRRLFPAPRNAGRNLRPRVALQGREPRGSP